MTGVIIPFSSTLLYAFPVKLQQTLQRPCMENNWIAPTIDLLALPEPKNHCPIPLYACVSCLLKVNMGLSLVEEINGRRALAGMHRLL